MTTVIVVQARMDSDRLPGKTLMDIYGQPMIDHVLARARFVQGVDRVVLATETKPCDDELAAHVESLGIPVWRHAHHANVLRCYAECAEAYKADIVVRLTGDCPLVDPALVEQALALYRGTELCDLVYTTPGWPDGLDVEVMGAEALAVANIEAETAVEREHVTGWLRKWGMAFPLSATDEAWAVKYPKWSVDTQEELDFVRRVMPLLPMMPMEMKYGWRATVAAIQQLEAE